jgi:magnesium chelatase subunit I
VRGLREQASKYLEPKGPDETAVAMELVLEGLHQHSMLSRERSGDGAGGATSYKDMLKSMLTGLGD